MPTTTTTTTTAPLPTSISKILAGYTPTQIDAVTLHLERRERLAHPDGHFDKGKRWYPEGRDQEVMASTREPSRRWPLSQNRACRSLSHCCRYFDVPSKGLRRLRKQLDAVIEVHDAKAVLQEIATAAVPAPIPGRP